MEVVRHRKGERLTALGAEGEPCGDNVGGGVTLDDEQMEANGLVTLDVDVPTALETELCGVNLDESVTSTTDDERVDDENGRVADDVDVPPDMEAEAEPCGDSLDESVTSDDDHMDDVKGRIAVNLGYKDVVQFNVLRIEGGMQLITALGAERCGHNTDRNVNLVDVQKKASGLIAVDEPTSLEDESFGDNADESFTSDDVQMHGNGLTAIDAPQALEAEPCGDSLDGDDVQMHGNGLIAVDAPKALEAEPCGNNLDGILNFDDVQMKANGLIAVDVPYKDIVEFDDLVNEAQSDYELAYGTSGTGQNIPWKFDHAKNKFMRVGRPADFVEFDKVRVARAMGTTLDDALPNSSCERRDLGRKNFVLIDLSGTIHVEDESTPKASFALASLRARGFPILFVTNTTKESKRALHERLTRIGLSITMDEIYTSLDATRNYLLEHGLRPMLLVADEAKEDFDGVSTDDPNCVVIGLSTAHFNRDDLSAAMRLVIDKNAPIIAIHKGRCLRTGSGMSLGPGPFVVALEKASRRVAIVLGKPDKNFYDGALMRLGCENPLDAVMIGDDVRDDVYGAMRAGMTGILVKTGKWTPTDEHHILPNKPDYVCDNFAAAVELIIEEKLAANKQQT